MNIRVVDVNQFLNNVGNYIIDQYHIIPRDFTLSHDYAKLSQCSLIYTEDGRVLRFTCNYEGNRENLHTHINDSQILAGSFVYCSNPEKLAVVYIDNSIFHPRKHEIMTTLHEWLPSATVDQVAVTFNSSHTIEVFTHLEPSYAIHFLNQSRSRDNAQRLIYYFASNIVDKSKDYTLQTNNFKIMVRPRRMRRRRSRSRSPGAGTRTRRRSRSRSRSPRRSRSRSPSARRGTRRRSRSRSRA